MESYSVLYVRTRLILSSSFEEIKWWNTTLRTIKNKSPVDRPRTNYVIRKEYTCISSFFEIANGALSHHFVFRQSLVAGFVFSLSDSFRGIKSALITFLFLPAIVWATFSFRGRLPFDFHCDLSACFGRHPHRKLSYFSGVRMEW